MRGFVDQTRQPQYPRAARGDGFPVILAGEGFKSPQEPRGNRGLPACAGRTGENHLAGAGQHCEIMRALANPALRRLQAEIQPHRPIEEGILLGNRRETAFVEAADNDAVRCHKPGLKWSEDRCA